MAIDFEDFAKVDIRVGTVVGASRHPAARKPAYVLEVDFGSGLGRRTTSAQLTERYTVDQLIGRQVAAVVNFPPKRIAGVRSEVLVLGFPDAEGRVVLVGVDHPVPDGGRLF
jgi:tRNA-binding protein